jgi:hypothetical protein
MGSPGTEGGTTEDTAEPAAGDEDLVVAAHEPEAAPELLTQRTRTIPLEVAFRTCHCPDATIPVVPCRPVPRGLSERDMWWID